MVKLYWNKIIEHFPYLKNQFDIKSLIKIGIEFEENEGYIEIDVPTNEKFLNIPSFINRLVLHINKIELEHTPLVLNNIKFKVIKRPELRFTNICFSNDETEFIYQLAYLFNQQILVQNSMIIYSANSPIKTKLGINSDMISDYWYSKSFIDSLKEYCDIEIETIEKETHIEKELPDLNRFPYISDKIFESSALNISKISNNKCLVPMYLKHLTSDHIFEILNIKSTEFHYIPNKVNIDNETILIKKIQDALRFIPHAFTETILVPSKNSIFYMLGNIKLHTGHYLRTNHIYGLLLFFSKYVNINVAYDIGKIFTKNKSNIITEKNILTIMLGKKMYDKMFYKINLAIETYITYKALSLIDSDIWCGYIKVGEIEYIPKEFLEILNLKQDYITITLFLDKLEKSRIYNNREQILLLDDTTTEYCLMLSNTKLFFNLLKSNGIRYRTLYNGYLNKEGLTKLNIVIYNMYKNTFERLIEKENLVIV